MVNCLNRILNGISSSGTILQSSTAKTLKVGEVCFMKSGGDRVPCVAEYLTLHSIFEMECTFETNVNSNVLK